MTATRQRGPDAHPDPLGPAPSGAAAPSAPTTRGVPPAGRRHPVRGVARLYVRLLRRSTLVLVAVLAAYCALEIASYRSA
ncbi:MAG TPA: hypothetical protein VF143_05940, partial [Candidatus Nanopelagicales bacterium]